MVSQRPLPTASARARSSSISASSRASSASLALPAVSATATALSRPAAVSAKVRRSSRIRSANLARIWRWTSSRSDARRPSVSKRTSSTNAARNARACCRRSASCRRRSLEDLLATEHRRHAERRRPDDRRPQQRAQHPEHLDPDARAADDPETCHQARLGAALEGRPALPPPPPRIAQNRSGCSSALAVTQPAVRCHDLGRDERIDRQAVLAHEPADAAAQCQTRRCRRCPHRRTAWQARGHPRQSLYSPAVSPGCAQARRRSGSMWRPFIALRSSRIPPWVVP